MSQAVRQLKRNQRSPSDRSELVRRYMAEEIRDAVRQRGLTQAQAAKEVGVHQPRISDLMNGKEASFTLEALFDIGEKIGVVVELNTVRRPAAASLDLPL